jgi:hypothetical protein
MTRQVIEFLVVGIILLVASGIEESELRQAHARVRARVLNAVRVGTAYSLLVLALLARAQSVAMVMVLGAAALALMLAPTSWLLRAGGLERAWEIRQTFESAWQLRFDEGMPLSPSTVAALQKLRVRLDSLRTSDLSEWIELMVADIDDWIRGARWPLGQALRLIRRHEIDVELLGAEAPLAQRSPEEATFLWHMYRLYARMLDAGAAPRSAEVDLLFEGYLDGLDQFRRLDTLAFIDAVQASARAWLGSGPKADPWPPVAGIEGLEPGMDTPSKTIWPNVHVLWGAELDEDDRRELATSLTGRG